VDAKNQTKIHPELMSFDKVEVRVFSGPDQVQVGSNTEPDLIVMNIGPKGDTGATGNTGATGPAGPNSVTSATTSDGTANLSIADLEVVGGEIYTDGDYSQIYTQGTDAHIFTLGSGAEIFTEGELAQIYTTGASAQIYTAGAGATIGTQGANATIYTQGANATISTAGSAAHIQTSHASAAVKSTNFAAVESGGASLVDGSMQPCLTWSAGGRNLTIPSGTATTFNTTSYTYGTGAAAAHRDSLGLTTLATTTPAINVATFLATPTSTNLAAAVTGETGSGALVFGTSPTIDAPTISGSAAFTSTTRPTSAGTGTPAATSLMTRADGDARYLQNFILGKTSDTARGNTNTPTSDPTLIVAINETGSYIFEIFIRIKTSPLGGGPVSGMKFGVIYSGTGSIASSYIGWVSSVAASFLRGSLDTFSTYVDVTALNASENQITIKGLINATTTGNFSLAWSPYLVSATETTIVKSGSFLTLTKLA
jgi:hypothetical protein